MIPRLYVTAPLHTGQAVALTGGQAHYLNHVLRRTVGDEILLFNGKDGEFQAEIGALNKKGGVAAVGQQTRVQISSPDLHLYFAPVKRGPMEVIAQKACELGAAAIQPVMTARTMAQRVNVDRLNAIVIEAAEQSERLDVPSVREPVSFADALAQMPVERQLMFCDEAGDDETAPWGGPHGRAAPVSKALQRASGGPWAIFIGPEGGFSPDERASLRALAQVTPVSLGPRILRADTAAIAAISLWQAFLGDWNIQ